ncbi:GNAT family N-acetyltransferase [Pontibacillus salicampi]|uniref:GNAT family N-acetyltransferase n=1 Tax=Pontibacillus salicampi TaxID=1449801 RepID=A0ABV6LU87_9BACI
MPLTGEHVQLTAFEKEDLQTIIQWHQDARFLRQFDAAIAKPKTMQEMEKWYEEAASSNDGFLFAIRTKETNTLIGYMELDSILWNQRNAWVSIAIGDDAYRGKGYGTEAMQLLMAFAFEECNLHRLQLTVFENNERALRMYERLGFTREGAFREYVYRDDRPVDMVLYGLLKREWKEGSAS